MGYIIDADTVEEPVEGVVREEIMVSFEIIMIGKASGPSEVYAEMILSSGGVGISVDGILPENTRWKRNAIRLGHQCCNSYFERKGRYHELWYV